MKIELVEMLLKQIAIRLKTITFQTALETTDILTLIKVNIYSIWTHVFVRKQEKLYIKKPMKNFYKFCQHFPIQNISESANLRHTWFCQNFAHLLITSKTLFQNIFPNNNLKASLQGELTKYLSASPDTKNICLLVTLPPRQDRFQDNTYVFNNWYQQFPQQNNRPDSTSAENIDSPNFINIEKLYAHYSNQTTNVQNSWTIPLMLPRFHLSD